MFYLSAVAQKGDIEQELRSRNYRIMIPPPPPPPPDDEPQEHIPDVPEEQIPDIPDIPETPEDQLPPIHIPDEELPIPIPTSDARMGLFMLIYGISCLAVKDRWLIETY